MSLVLEELTAAGHGGISVLSLRGPEALVRLGRIAPKSALPPPGALRLVRLQVGEELLDEALIHVRGPDHAELSLHGSPAVVRRIAAALGIPVALPGRDRGARAPLEDRAEALLGHAACEAGARVLLDQAEGALRRALVALDPRDAAGCAAGVDRLLAAGRNARYLLRPAVVVLAGPPNAGKSTLFNVLCDRERVVVSDTAGTTRDAVREPGLLGAYAVEFVDTAGDRTPPDDPGSITALERAGIELGRRVREGADLVLWLARDPAVRPPVVSGPTVLARLTSAADLLDPAARAAAEHAISARDEPAAARAEVEAVFLLALHLPRDPWTPGTPVPFTQDLLETLEVLRGQEGEAGRRSVLDELLAR